MLQSKQFEATYGAPVNQEILEAIVSLGKRLQEDEQADILEDLEQLIRQEPGSHQLRYFAIASYSPRNELDRAFYHLAVGIALFPNSPIFLRRLAKACKSNQDPKSMTSLLERGWQEHQRTRSPIDQDSYIAPAGFRKTRSAERSRTSEIHLCNQTTAA